MDKKRKYINGHKNKEMTEESKKERKGAERKKEGN
jgi:hypothetical protein